MGGWMSRCMKWQVGGWMDEQVDGWVEGWSVDVERIKIFVNAWLSRAFYLMGGNGERRDPV